MMHDAVGYTPYEGHVYKGWPEMVLSRGRMVVEGGELKVARGSGKYLARGVPGPVATADRRIDGPARKLRKLIDQWLDTSRSPRPSSGRSTRRTPAPLRFRD